MATLFRPFGLCDHRLFWLPCSGPLVYVILGYFGYPVQALWFMRSYAILATLFRPFGLCDHRLFWLPCSGPLVYVILGYFGYPVQALWFM